MPFSRTVWSISDCLPDPHRDAGVSAETALCAKFNFRNEQTLPASHAADPMAFRSASQDPANTDQQRGQSWIDVLS